MDRRGEIWRNLKNPPVKDTVGVPDGGFTVIRFLADNPGYWLVHCHMSWHNHNGKAFVVRVGDAAKDVAPVPQGFPTCGDFNYEQYYDRVLMRQRERYRSYFLKKMDKAASQKFSAKGAKRRYYVPR